VDDGDHVALTDTEMRLRSIWEQILTLNHRKVTAETDFFHVGGSSLLLLSLQARIREVFNINMPLIRMFESSTLGAMAHRIEHGMQHEVAAEAIDWDKETALSPTLLNPASQPSPPPPTEPPTKPSVVILTGATGQLGQALLASLVADPHIKHIHCIGVRNAQHRQNQTPFPNPKITLHEGDLVLPRLGLSAPTAAAIFTSADAIIHNAADMSYLKTYASLRAANLQSTKELVNLTAAAALSKKPTIPFHYISTVSVGNIPALHHVEAAEEYVFRPGSVRAYPPPPLSSSSVDIAKTAHGYVASKWASEVFLERVCEQWPGWDVVIHRPSLIMRPQLTEEGALGKGGGGGGGLEFVENLRRFAGLLRAVPVVGMNHMGGLGDGGKGVRVSGSFDVVSLEEVVRGVMEAVVGTGRADAEVSSLRFLHHIGGVELPLGDLKSWVADEGQEGDDIQEMEALEWARRAGELGMHPTMVAMVQELAAAETGRLVLPRLGR
jgi:nucleoside-diphosphate-sugar epimerase